MSSAKGWMSVANLTVTQQRDVLHKLRLATERLVFAENKTSVGEIMDLLNEALDILRRAL